MSGEPEMTVVSETGLGAHAVALVAEAGADVLDTVMPDIDGLTVARELRDRYAGLGVVLLTSNGEDDVLFRALEVRVSAFVPKSAPAAEVLAASQYAAVAAGSFIARVSPAIARRYAAVVAQGIIRPFDGSGTPLYVSHSTTKTCVARVYEKLARRIARRH